MLARVSAFCWKRGHAGAVSLLRDIASGPLEDRAQGNMQSCSAGKRHETTLYLIRFGNMGHVGLGKNM